MLKVYLAGPEVFFLNGREVIDKKRELTRKYGFEPNEFGDEGVWPTDKYEVGGFLSKLNETVMRDSDFAIANMTPFRGLSTDVGTAFEIGFMCALERPVFGYTNDPRHYDERAASEFYNGEVAFADDGMLRANVDGQMVEDHLMADNLMLDGGIDVRGGVVVRYTGTDKLAADDLTVFEQCLAAARAYYDKAGS